MEYDFYLDKFKKSVDQLDRKLMAEKNLELYVGTYSGSVVLKLYKKQWTNDKVDPINARTRIFFSIWVNESTIKQNKIYYNIHAFKLRELKGFSVASRKFAHKFRIEFKKHLDDWKNVSVKFGPLTLMEGWNTLKVSNLEITIFSLAVNFMKIDSLIDEILKTFKKPNV